jgi:hypothetical protein
MLAVPHGSEVFEGIILIIAVIVCLVGMGLVIAYNLRQWRDR